MLISKTCQLRVHISARCLCKVSLKMCFEINQSINQSINQTHLLARQLPMITGAVQVT